VRVLFVDLDYHLKTKSADFFLEILRSGFEVETHYYATSYRADVPQEKIDRADVVIAWEAMLGRRDFVIPNKPCIYIPMYDCDWGSRAQWKRIARSGCHVVSFCNEITKMAQKGGVPTDRILELRYAYDPAAFQDASGDPAVAAIWERGFFGIAEVKKLFPPGFFRKLVLFRRPQPGLVYGPISEQDGIDYNIEVNDSAFLPKEEYLNILREPGVFIAPRPKEGIGMAFLEQLAMGKCVIVHDDGSMNEYVKNGVNGIVRDFYKSPAPISKEEIGRARNGVLATARCQYERWLTDRAKIVPFVEAVAKSPPVRIGGIVDLFWRSVYLVEAALARI